MYRNRLVSLVLVGLFVWLTGCSTYTQIAPSEVADHGRVRVTRDGGARQTFYEPWLAADSIKGRARRGGALAVPLQRVLELEAVGTDEVGTVILIVVLFGGIAATAVAASNTCWAAFC